MDNYNPTPTHFFIKMLQEKRILWKNLTQNIDNLEEKTGLDMDQVLQCHGATRGATCCNCNRDADEAELKEHIKLGTPLWCLTC